MLFELNLQKNSPNPLSQERSQTAQSSFLLEQKSIPIPLVASRTSKSHKFHPILLENGVRGDLGVLLAVPPPGAEAAVTAPDFYLISIRGGGGRKAEKLF